MTDEESRIEAEAITFANAHKKEVAIELTGISKFPADTNPVSVFMAGSPGAGKTESSQNLIAKLTDGGHKVLRIDPDELRSRFKTYTGANSHLFQGATSILAERIHDRTLDNKQSFVFDGTLSNLGKARENIQRSLKRKRLVQIIYVYQNPIQAWEFVKAREKRDGRHIPKERFIEQYFQARENVNILKAEFKKDIGVDLIVKNIDGTDFRYWENIDQIDRHVPERYSEETLRSELRP
jgi:predicted ABC-type ATPase